MKTGLTILISVLMIYGIVWAGSLTPSATPTATSYTLDDIYTRLTTNDTATEANHSFTPAGVPAGTLRTFKEIYDAIPTIVVGEVKSSITYLGITGDYPSSTYPLDSADATTDLAGDGSNITSSNEAVEWWQSDGNRQTATLDFPTLSNVCDTDTSNGSTGTFSATAVYISVGNTYCGTAGTLLADLFNGSLTAGGFDGGSQANGGVDDYNDGGSAASGRYEKGWTACVSGNNWCGTDTDGDANDNEAGADAQDDSTGLIWSLPCNGSKCASFSDATAVTYEWDEDADGDSGDSNNGSLDATALCTSGDHGVSGWFLPHQKQLMQAYINGSYGNLEATGVNRNYWSATTYSSFGMTSAWKLYLSSGSTYSNAKTNAGYVRCVRQS